MLVEHARNLLGIDDASHDEYGTPGTQIVTELACALRESEIAVEITPDTLLHSIHGTTTSVEGTNCSYGLAPDFDHIAADGGLIISAIDGTGEVRAVERPDHPFFLATLYQPQRRSSAAEPHPVWLAFVDAVLAHRAVSSPK